MAYLLDGYTPFTIDRDTAVGTRIGSLAGTTRPRDSSVDPITGLPRLDEPVPYLRFELIGANNPNNDGYYFRIDADGTIWVNRALDTGNDGPYVLLMNAYYSDTSSRQVQIEILVAEDELSHFNVSGKGVIAENDAGADIDGISITTSRDDAVNAFTEWTITGTDDLSAADAHKFRIMAKSDNSGYMLALKAGESLDFEAGEYRHLAITARDNDNNPITKTVTIRVTDVQEKPVILDPETGVPLADNETLLAYVASDATRQYRPVITLKAFDGDGDTLDWSIKSGNPNAGVNQFGWPTPLFGTYGNDITLLSDMPSGGAPRYELVLEVRERYGGKTDDVTVIIEVRSGAPTLLVSGTGMVTENVQGANTGITLTLGHAADNTIWTITDANGDDQSHLYDLIFNGTAYELKLKDGESLDHEKADTQHLTITAHNGVSAAEAMVTINVADVNEPPVFLNEPLEITGDANQPPVFQNEPYELTVAENYNVNYSLFRFFIENPETEALTYRIISGNNDGIFIVRPAFGKTGGIIWLNRQKNLNYEEAQQHILGIEVRDAHGNVATTTLTINITNIDEGTARFTIAGMNAGTPMIGQTLTATINTDDPDGNGDGAFSYQWFTEDSGTKTDIANAINAAYTPVAADAGKKIGVRVTYTDAAGKSEAVETISVHPVNAAPVITSDHHAAIALAEDYADTTTAIATVTATDADGDALTYAITVGNDAGLFEIDSMTGVITLADGASLDFETAPQHVMTVEVSDGNGGIAATTITINVSNLDEGAAIIAITAGTGVDLDALDVGDALVASVQTADPDGVPAGASGTWRWFHQHNPDVEIGTGDSYTLTEADRGEMIGVEYVYTDVLDAANSTMSKAVALLNKVIPRIIHQQSDDDKAADTAITLSDTATEVDAGDGSDIITGGAGNDQITGGKGDDLIDLGADNTDTDTVIYGIGGRTAKDGADTVTNFNRGVDQFVFALENNADTAGITDYDGFIRFITKGTDTLDDDEFMVQLDLGTDGDGNTQLEGLFFHFAGSSVFSGGRVSLPLVKISFAEPVDTAGIAGILTDDAGQAVNPGQVVNPYLFVTDLDYLDDFLGGSNAITFTINDI